VKKRVGIREEFFNEFKAPGEPTPRRRGRQPAKGGKGCPMVGARRRQSETRSVTGEEGGNVSWPVSLSSVRLFFATMRQEANLLHHAALVVRDGGIISDVEQLDVSSRVFRMWVSV